MADGENPNSGSGDSLVQEHEGCDECVVAVRSQPGRDVELIDRRSRARLLLLKVTADDDCWLADALNRAFEHARSGHL